VEGLVSSQDPESHADTSAIGFPLPDKSKVKNQTKRSTLVVQVGDLGWVNSSSLVNPLIAEIPIERSDD